MKRLAIALATIASLLGPDASAAAPVCDPGAFDMQVCFPSLTAPVLAWPGGIGIPKVITWASTAGDSGIAWGSTASITGANAYITYDGSNILINFPTGKKAVFQANADASGLPIITTTNPVIQDGSDGTLGIAFSGIAGSAVIGLRASASSMIEVTDFARTADSAITGAVHAEVPALQWPTAGVTAPAGTEPYVDYDGSNLISNVPTGKAAVVKINGTSTGLQISNSGTAPTAVVGTAYLAGFQDPSATSSAPLLFVAGNGTNTGAGYQFAEVSNSSGAQKFLWTATVGAATADATTGHLSVPALQWPTAGVTAPASTEPYWTYDGSSMIANDPSGKSFLFKVNGTSQLSISATSLTMAGTDVTLSMPASSSDVLLIGAGSTLAIGLSGASGITNIPWSITLISSGAIAGSVAGQTVSVGQSPNISGTITGEICTVTKIGTGGAGTSACSYQLWDNTASATVFSGSDAACNQALGTATQFTSFSNTVAANHQLMMRVTVPASNTVPPFSVQCDFHF